MKQKEFVVLMALLMSFVALAIDAMLPALGLMAESLGVEDPNDMQLVITSIFLGMGTGQLFYGAASDAYGRKPVIYAGLVIFVVGTVVSYLSTSFDMMIGGRVLQGIGAAASRVVTLAMVRDRFEGNAMARIMSLIMILFVLVPALAPSIGQGILHIGDWRDIFALMIGLAAVGFVWFWLRQPETLARENRLDFSLQRILAGVKETVSHRAARGFTVASGLIFGAFVGYLSSAQQVLQVKYGLGETFSYYFGGLALSVGLASFVNARLVERLGMLKICTRSLQAMVSVALLFTGVSLYFEGQPPLFLLISYLAITFFLMGLLFGNFNALAVQPLGHIAGVANSVISSSQTVLSAILGGSIGFAYNGTVFPMVLGFLILGGVALFITMRAGKEAIPAPS